MTSERSKRRDLLALSFITKSTGLCNTYPLYSDLSRRMPMDSAIYLLNKLGLELSKVGSGKMWIQAWPFLKQKHLSPIRRLSSAILRCSKIRSRGSSNTPKSLKLQKQTWLSGAHFYCLGYQFLYVKKTDPNIMEQRIARSTLPKGFLETPDQLSFTPVVLTLRGSIMRLSSWL